jgi:hypothetical protein
MYVMGIYHNDNTINLIHSEIKNYVRVIILINNLYSLFEEY